MKKSRLDPNLLSRVLQETLPQQDPYLVGNTSDYGLFLAAYQNYINCRVAEHYNSFHTLEIVDEKPQLFHRRAMGDCKAERLLQGGEVSVCPADAGYFFDSSDDANQREGVSFTLVVLEAKLVEELSMEEFGTDQFEILPKFMVDDTEQIRGLVNIIKLEISNGYPNGSFFLENIRNALIRIVLRKSAKFRKAMAKKDTSSIAKNRVDLIKEILKNDLNKDISLEDLEVYLGISKFHISRSFQQAEGISISTYLKQIRVENAQQLLINYKSWSIATIAQECGFHDASHLNRYFKALTGITPTQFREQFQKRIDIY